jgi:nitrate reductase gamma subunit
MVFHLVLVRAIIVFMRRITELQPRLPDSPMRIVVALLLVAVGVVGVVVDPTGHAFGFVGAVVASCGMALLFTWGRKAG